MSAYGIQYHMAARLLYRSKFVYADGAIREMVLWQLPAASKERHHRLKYRLHYSSVDGRDVVRYDNERGKGDHRHFGGREARYRFIDVEALVADFLADIESARRARNEEET